MVFRIVLALLPLVVIAGTVSADDRRVPEALTKKLVELKALKVDRFDRRVSSTG